jgi:hypothetical protein
MFTGTRLNVTVWYLIKHHDMKAHGGSGGRVQSILNFSEQLHNPAAWTPAKLPWYPLNSRLHCPHNTFGCRGEDIIYCPCHKSDIPLPSTPVTTPIKLPRFRIGFINQNVLRDIISSNLHYLEICALLEFYTELNGRFLPTFRENLKAPYFSVKQTKTLNADAYFSSSHLHAQI